MKNKIGLCVAFKGTNYGMLLQAFATQQIVEKMGFRTEILDYSPEQAAFFDRLPAKRTFLVRPALVKDGMAIKKGLVCMAQEEE